MKNRINEITTSQGFKAGTLIMLTLIMLIPVSMVNSLIRERSYRAIEVKEEISSDAGGVLQFAAPVLRIPGTRQVENVHIDSEGNKSSELIEQDFVLWYAPEVLDINIELESENKYRGIFYTPVFRGDVALSGFFNNKLLEKDLEDNESLSIEKAEVIIPFFNQKGIRKVYTAYINGSPIDLQPGSRDLAFGSGGIYAEIPAESAKAEKTSFNIKLLISGAGRVSILPLASATSVAISTDWPAPAFRGLCLPDSHTITDDGFNASWNCSSLSSGLPLSWDERTVFDSYTLSESQIETDFVNIHDHYEQNERAAKYAILFILIPFITLFLFENFFKKKIHAIQYILAATANIIFFLLLLSLSEHMSFNSSYLISAAAVTIMLSLYARSVLKNKRAFSIAPVMLFIYLFLFVTLQSEDWALLIGSIGVFIITALLMFITTRTDFYQYRKNQK